MPFLSSRRRERVGGARRRCRACERSGRRWSAVVAEENQRSQLPERHETRSGDGSMGGLRGGNFSFARRSARSPLNCSRRFPNPAFSTTIHALSLPAILRRTHIASPDARLHAIFFRQPTMPPHARVRSSLHRHYSTCSAATEFTHVPRPPP